MATILVRRVRLSRWRGTLGSIATTDRTADVQTNTRAILLAAAIERAALRLPVATKCLARAVALQWRLRLSGIPSELVVAFHATDRSGDDGFHAWIEHGGQIIIGHCDRTLYRPVLTLSQSSAA